KDNSALNITHSIITANKGITCLDSAVCVSIYNDVFCINQNYSGTSAGTGCISTNPLYTDIGDYSLKEQSSCWTAGYMQLSIGWQRINLVENSGFELGTTTWGSAKNAVLAISSDALSGNSSLKVTTPGFNYYEGVYGSYNGYQVEKGKTYTASAYVKVAKTPWQGKVKICLWGTKSGWTYANQVTDVNCEWQKISVTKTITDNEMLVVHILTWESPQAITLNVDKVELVEVKDYKTVCNGDFEMGINGWRSYNTAMIEIYPASLLGGSALMVTTPGIVPTEGFSSSIGYQVEKGKTYTASAYVKVAKTPWQGKVKICLWGTKSGWTYANQVTDINCEWQKISVTKTITNNEILVVSILTWVSPQAITLNVDKVELMEVKDYKTVCNGDFELGTTGWLPNHNTVLAISSDALSGNSSLKVTTPGFNYYEGVYSSVSYQVKKGKTYTASAYVKSLPGSGKVKICLHGSQSGWTYANQVTELNSVWRKISVTKTIAATNEALCITIYTWDAPQAITLYIDKVELEEDNYVGCWNLDEGAGTTAHDSSWRGNNGTLQGSPQWTNGWINGALSVNVNGSSNYVDCGSNTSFKVTAITMAAWVYSPTTNFSGYNGIAGAVGAYGYDIWDNKIAVHINTVNQGWHWCQYSPPLSWDGWHHVAFTYDGVNTLKCYRDGVLILTDTASSSGPLQWGSAQKLYIGQVNTGAWPSHFKGLIDEVKIYNRALRADEIMNDWYLGY
ncbi:MAG: carbohydrate binding domain-containing protein, partial [Verrucomicrobia bacterium]|nr:carbohydrate binding domain-containing protein [Verrucomicrobiota bacterium]